MKFLETVMAEYSLMRARHFAGGYEGVTHAGIALVALDTRRVFLTKRAHDPTDAPEVADTWEFPGGGLKDGEEPYPGAVREVIEETGWGIPDDSTVTGGWRSDDGVYQGFLVVTDTEFAVDGWTPTTECSDIGWFDRAAVESLAEVDALRPEVRDQTDWDMIFAAGEQVSGNEDTMTEPSQLFALTGPIPVHGVIAPEEAESGDARGFNAGSMTARPLRLPFAWQKINVEHHNGSVVVGSVDRMMRKDGLIHWEGLLMESPEADEFAGVMSFFDGRYGVSVDGDKGSMDKDKTQATGVLWFDAVRASGLTAVSIPAFHEAYVAFGPHPDMPAPEDALTASMHAAGDLIGGQQTFDRGPGWVTNPEDTKRIHDYWTKKGEPGYEKIAWGTSGDYRRCRVMVGEEIGENSPTKLRFINQICAQWHHDALGYWPGDLGKPGNAPDTPENRRRAATHASLGEDDAALDAVVESVEGLTVVPDHNEAEWEAVLVSSAAGGTKRPPLRYFHRQEDSENTVIEEPDEDGFRHTHGYAAEWGVCHIGFDGQCVEPPIAGSDDYPEFHLGRTKTAEGYIRTGLLTYAVAHRDAKKILSESPTQAHFDNIKNAWAAVRLGEDERGIWFSGVVLPKVDEEDITLIQASGQVSGEWKHGALRACLTVGVPGFPVVSATAEYDDDGNVLALAASAFGSEGCPPSPTERMAALRIVDAEVRFADLRNQYLRETGA